MGVVHVWLGAAAGSLAPDTPAAMVAGALSHAAGDMIPHEDGAPGIDTLAAVASLGYIALRRGLLSKEVVGALAAVAPDVEHVARRLGHPLTRRPFFPTHNRRLPHPRSGSYSSQIVTGTLAALFVLWVRPEPGPCASRSGQRQGTRARRRLASRQPAATETGGLR